MWPHVGLDVLILVITIAESFVKRNTKSSSLHRNATSETIRFKTTWVIFLSLGDIIYSTGLSTGNLITTVSAVLVCPEETLI